VGHLDTSIVVEMTGANSILDALNSEQTDALLSCRAEAAHNNHLFSQKCEFSHIFDDFLLFRLFRTDKITVA